ncbi:MULTISPECIES: hypothetical protein [unclassified Pseudonocardia]|uniref:hypothetical protein n=1 Tax=unclassified Pseudonocardia TaxID=2619320 RepID=UPI0011150668|nr:hypothetical protein [Pseudonocardia sp. Ae707_Ps1]
MAKHKLGVVSPEEVHALLSPTAQAESVGQLKWDEQKSGCYEGVLEVTTSVSNCERSSLRIYVVRLAASEFSLQYLIGTERSRRVAIRRLDVNGDHKDLINTTHKHKFNAETGHESAYVPTDIPNVDLGPTVPIGTYQQIFEAFASECHVSLDGDYWSEPW